MYCQSCHYNLRAVPSGICPECGRLFDSANARTYTKRHRRPSLLLGFLFPINLAVVAFPGIRFAFNINYLPERHQAFGVIYGIGLVLGMTAGILAGLPFASDKFYRVWQATPNASAEACADRSPMAALLMGWVPGVMFLGAVFDFTPCARWFLGEASRKSPRSTPPPSPPMRS
jgi:hypothetical protein